MKGVVIAGGTGSRLYPLTKIMNKNVLAVYDKPLIYYPILTLRDAGVREILIISGQGQAGQYLDLMGSGVHMGVHLSYEIQESPGGIAQAVQHPCNGGFGNRGWIEVRVFRRVPGHRPP